MKWTDKALDLLLLDYETGFTAEQIARDIGVTKQYVYKLLRRARKRLPDRPHSKSLDNLSAFCRIRLSRAGLTTPEQIKAALENGNIKKAIPFRASIDEIERWIKRLYP